MDMFHNNKPNNNMFPMVYLSFQASQPIRSSKDMLVNIYMIKCFLGQNRREVQLQEEDGKPT